MGAPSHTLALVFSGQSDAVLGGGNSSSSTTTGSKPLFVGANPTTGAPAPADASVRDTTMLLSQWRSNLASLIANRPKGWRKLAIDLGDALLSSQNTCGGLDSAAAAAHCCYVVSGEPPLGVCGKCGRGLGVAPASATTSSDGSTSLASSGSLNVTRAQQRAQVLEWCLLNTQPQPPPHALADFQRCKLEYAKVVLRHTRNNLGTTSVHGDGTTAAGATTPLTEQAPLYAKALRTTVDNISAAAAAGGPGNNSSNNINSVFESAFLNDLAAFEAEVAPHPQGGNSNDQGSSNNGGNGFFSRVGSGILGSLEKLSQAEEEEAAETQLAADNAAAAAAATTGGPYAGGAAPPPVPGPTFGSSSASFNSGVQRPTPIATSSSSSSAFPAYHCSHSNNRCNEMRPPQPLLMSSSSDGAVAANGGFNSNDFGFGDGGFGDSSFGESSGSMVQPPQPPQMHEPGSPSIFERSKSTPNDLGKAAAAALPDTPTAGSGNRNSSSSSSNSSAFGRSSSTGGGSDGASSSAASNSTSAKSSGSGASNSKVGADVTAKKGWLATKVARSSSNDTKKYDNIQ